MASTSSQAAHSDDPNSTKVSGFESKAVDSVDGVLASCPSGVAPVNNSDSHANQDGGSCGETAVGHRDELLPTRSVILDLPAPPPRPVEEKTVQKMEGIAWGSELPDGVIFDILTKMGTKDLVRCSLISKRWLHECRRMMDLSFVLHDIQASVSGEASVEHFSGAPSPSSDTQTIQKLQN